MLASVHRHLVFVFAIVCILLPFAAYLQAEIIETRAICKQSNRYIGWPSIAQAANGNIIAVFSGNRTAHVSPDGITQMVQSVDGGQTWSSAITIQDLPIDDRDAGIIQTAQGTMLASWFTGPPYDTELQGSYVIRSEDNGSTWGDPIRVPVATPHGPIQLSDGRLLYMGQSPHCSHVEPHNYNGAPSGSPYTVSVVESLDDGLTWQQVTDFPVPATERMLSFDEPHMVEVSGGKIIALFRDCNAPDRMWQSNSYDGGSTWAVPYRTPMQGHPPHVIELDNGWLLNVYAKRSGDMGQYACISRNQGLTWEIENEIKLADANESDMGYPASTQLPDGSIWTVYYQKDQPDEHPSLMGTHWSLDGLIPDSPPSGLMLRHLDDNNPVDESFVVDGEVGTPVYDDNGRPAWNIAGGFSRYRSNLQYPQLSAMQSQGWHATMDVCNLLDNDSATDWGVHLEVSDETDTYLMLIGSDAEGNPTLYHLAAINGYTMEEIPLNGIAGDGYHRYEMLFAPNSPGVVDVFVDGLFQASIEGADNTASQAWMSRIVFGSTDGSAISNANYSLVELFIGSEELIDGDANADGIVDEADAAILAANWQRRYGLTWSQGDFNHDGIVDEIDATILATNWQNTTNTFVSIPEPATFTLLAVFCTAAFFQSRTYRKQ